jgi:outer membrane lipopolysaccharide assembly protein LptE/RlpB
MIIRKRGSIKRAFLVTLLVTLLCSCGYQLVGVGEKGIFGGEISSLYISIFKNSTYEPNISQYVTDAFSKELLSMGLFTVNKESSDGYLQGTVKKITMQPTSLSIAGLAVEKIVSLELDVGLYRRNGTFIKRWALSDSETYRVDNISYEEYNRKDAIKRLSARMARRFSSFLLVDY